MLPSLSYINPSTPTSMPAPTMTATTDIVSSRLVRMANGHARRHSPTTLELTPWDLQFIVFDPIQKGILFRDKPSLLPDTFAASLARTLDFFPPLSGRLGSCVHDDGTTSFFIDCNDAGAGFTYAVADSVAVSDLVDPVYVPVDVISGFFPRTETVSFLDGSMPLLAVQVTELADGVFVGITTGHITMDGTSLWHFFNSWAEISRGADVISKFPVFDPWFPPGKHHPIRLPSMADLLDQNSMSDHMVDPPLLERVFNFSKDSLAKLKEKANSEAGCHKISTFQALSAHLWRSFVCATIASANGSQKQDTDPTTNNGITTGGLEKHFPLIASARARIPFPDGYFGNGAYAIVADNISENELLQNGLGFVALKINELVGRQTRESIMKFAEDWIKNPIVFTRRDMFKFLITSSPRFDMYGCDFGWGTPIAVRNGRGQRHDGRMTVDPSPESGGVCVVACLAPETMKAMEEDTEFIEFVAY